MSTRVTLTERGLDFLEDLKPLNTINISKLQAQRDASKNYFQLQMSLDESILNADIDGINSKLLPEISRDKLNSYQKSQIDHITNLILGPEKINTFKQKDIYANKPQLVNINETLAIGDKNSFLTHKNLSIMHGNSLKNLIKKQNLINYAQNNLELQIVRHNLYQENCNRIQDSIKRTVENKIKNRQAEKYEVFNSKYVPKQTNYKQRYINRISEIHVKGNAKEWNNYHIEPLMQKKFDKNNYQSFPNLFC